MNNRKLTMGERSVLGHIPSKLLFEYLAGGISIHSHDCIYRTLGTNANGETGIGYKVIVGKHRAFFLNLENAVSDYLIHTPRDVASLAGDGKQDNS